MVPDLKLAILHLYLTLGYQRPCWEEYENLVVSVPLFVG